MPGVRKSSTSKNPFVSDHVFPSRTLLTPRSPRRVCPAEEGPQGHLPPQEGEEGGEDRN